MLAVLLFFFFATVLGCTMFGAAVEQGLDPYADGAGFGGAVFGCAISAFVWLAFIFPHFLGN